MVVLNRSLSEKKNALILIDKFIDFKDHVEKKKKNKFHKTTRWGL